MSKCTRLAVLYVPLLACCELVAGQETYVKPPPPPTDCSEYPDQKTSLYILPWAVGESFRIERSRTHFTTRNFGVGLFAVDIEMPIGTPVHAARAGEVVATEGGFSDDGEKGLEENYVFIRHDDGTVARYVHLTENGPRVAVSQRVEQGQLIGISGNSGTFVPHTHFDVQRCGPNYNPKYNQYPCGYTLPVVFRNTKANACGLEPDQWYEAEAFRPDTEQTIEQSAERAIRSRIEDYVAGWYDADPDRIRRSLSSLFRKVILPPINQYAQAVRVATPLELLDHARSGLGKISVPAPIWDQFPGTLLALGGDDVDIAPADWTYSIDIQDLGTQYSVARLQTPHHIEILVLALNLGRWEIVHSVAFTDEPQ